MTENSKDTLFCSCTLLHTSRLSIGEIPCGRTEIAWRIPVRFVFVGLLVLEQGCVTKHIYSATPGPNKNGQILLQDFRANKGFLRNTSSHVKGAIHCLPLHIHGDQCDLTE